MSRIDKVRSLLIQEIATIVQQKCGDRRIGFVSLQYVTVSKDLRNATVFFSQIGNDVEKRQTVKALNAAAGFIKLELGKVLKMKTIPTLIFKYDESIERGHQLISKMSQ